MSKRCVVLGLGSNIEPVKHLRLALSEIKKLSQITVINVASIYESDALLPESAPSTWNKKYLNSAVELEVSNFEPFKLLQNIKAIEHKLGRAGSDRWAPRKIDIDILWVQDFTLQNESLNIPHAQILNRPFALLPLLELRPDFPFSVPDWMHRKPHPFHTEVSKTYVWPKMAGILNITEDSFSGDGVLLSPLKQLGKLLDDGAEIIDIGAESTRPGALIVDPEIEYQRLASTLETFNKYKKDYARDFEISIDSRKPEVMARVLNNYRIDYVNDVEGFRQPKMRELLKLTDAKAICMHSFSVPPVKSETIPEGEDLWSYLTDWWVKQKEIFAQENISTERMIFDPGIGFGKTPQQSVDILNYLEGFGGIREEIYLGYSRKSFLSLLTDKPAAERDPETALVTEAINQAYAQYLRVHNVAQNKQALTERTLL
ncbi:MAG: dihydropteroate synthase [Pseudobdellovibrio sp.]|nr:dihydropteroate synthase [Pseudobdellovibrio sp.]